MIINFNFLISVANMKIKKTLYRQVNELLNNNTPTMIFVDMDGVLAEYVYGEGNLILNGDTGVYLNKRPIQTVIDIVAKYYNVNNNEFRIITSCINFSQKLTKLKWIQKYMKFFDSDDFICVLGEDFEKRIDQKVNIICDYAKEQIEKKIIVVEDTHKILEGCWEKSNHKILPVHIINLIK